VRILIVSALIVAADQITKLMVKGLSLPSLGISIEGMRYGSSREIFGDFFRLTYIENPGMAFGIDIGEKPFLAIVSLAASVAIAIYLYQSRNQSLGYRASLAMILGGAVGNLIDRMFYGVWFGTTGLFHGRVVDFLDVDFFDVAVGPFHLSRWPVFNIADASVTIGVLLLLLLHRSAASVGDAVPVKAPSTPDPSVPVQHQPEQH